MSDYYLLTASAFLFLSGLYLATRKRYEALDKLIVLSLACLYFLITNLYFVSDYFTGKGFNEAVIYHLFYGVRGAGFGEYTGTILASFLFIGIGITGTYYSITIKKQTDAETVKVFNLSTTCLLIIAAIALNPVFIYLADNLFTEQRSDFYNYYKTPGITERPDVKRNVVFIYAEGLERTYFDETLFPGLINKLRVLESKGTHFTNLAQLWGTDWTMGGIVASQCGIPLATPSHGNSMYGMDRFLEGATCLGDLLADEGYQLSYLGGAYTQFAGKGKFYATHGFTDIQGRQSLGRHLRDKDYMNNWGLYDDSLFDFAYQKFEELSATNNPFGLFMLTLDTHPPEGSLSKSCNDIVYLDGSNPILNAVACSDHLIGRIIDKILDSKYAGNTIIVIASDHLSMRNTAYTLLKSANRTNMLIIIDPLDIKEKRISREGSTLDVGPVLLSSLGYKGSIGLGRNLLENETSLHESFPDINKSLKGWKDNFLDFWNFPHIKNGMLLNPIQKYITINDRVFRIPVLVEFDAQLRTTLKFQSDSDPSNRKLIDHVRDLGMNDPFIWVDSCNRMTSDRKAVDTCVVLGKLGAKEISGFKARGTTTISLHDLRNIILLKTSEENFNRNRKRFLHVPVTN